jgi:hypothetical protein
MTRNAGLLLVLGIQPNRMPTTFADKFAPISLQMLDEGNSIHVGDISGALAIRDVALTTK